MHACTTECVEVRGQLSEVSSLLPPSGAWGLNSGHLASQQGLLPAEPSHWPNMHKITQEQTQNILLKMVRGIGIKEAFPRVPVVCRGFPLILWCLHMSIHVGQPRRGTVCSSPGWLPQPLSHSLLCIGEGSEWCWGRYNMRS